MAKIPPYLIRLYARFVVSSPNLGATVGPWATAFTENAVMAQFDAKKRVLAGPHGQLAVLADDEVIHKFLMLQEGECEGPGPLAAAEKFGFSRQRYFQIRAAFAKQGSQALKSRKRGPKTHYRRTAEVERQVIRHRFLDADASPQVIAQKLVHSGWKISIRSVERVLADYGLQKKTPHVPSRKKRAARRGADKPRRSPARGLRSPEHRTRPAATAVFYHGQRLADGEPGNSGTAADGGGNSGAVDRDAD